ncbi:subunit 2 of RNA polymerase II transcription factor B [Hamiltosporidium tvaerminnensis]|uniref:RNA polymerase II transcription factor B subunit 2 n=2 Tax=Hamiltosporidium TaxID=1176354 RepID=A0A4Q9L7Y3_9MICR|nr:RNA polymerase II transcription factor B 52 kDa subunit [Hamiltosporidium tvaerminnensis]TBU03777.1 subunit 2 of RNA polymerase II transcription factor B [Hamiltosporidium magnivora]TBU04937.1 subunit 2 of RNA polymerase II transcription factor B [Hamiltosporidium tvaerminnensis]
MKSGFQYNDPIAFVSQMSNKSLENLLTNPIFSVSLLKIFDDYTVQFIFDLLTQTANIFKLPNTKEVSTTLKSLKTVNLIEKKGKNIFLNDIFRKSLLIGFSTIELNNIFTETTIDENKFTPDTINEIETNSTNKYNNLLRSIVEQPKVFHNEINISNKYNNILRSSSDQPKFFQNEIIKNLIVFIGLVDKNNNITNKGFEFSLKTTKEQLWILILYGIKYISKSQEEEVNFIFSIFELSMKNASKFYKLEKKSNLSSFLKILYGLGLCEIYDNNIIYLCKSIDILFKSYKDTKNTFLIIETNFKLYAYTNDRYQISLISLFSNIEIILPGLVVGIITEESLSVAFDKGITAQQITHFLQSNAKNNYFSETVKEQIFIWETKKERITSVDSYLYSGFLNLSDFQKVLNFCKQRNYLIEMDENKRLIVGKLDGHADIKNFIKENI